jgi:hypothetical protein
VTCDKDDHYYSRSGTIIIIIIIIIIRNKSNGIQLIKDKRIVGPFLPKTAGWIRYISRSEMENGRLLWR